MPDLRGWLLDVYADSSEGVVVWLLGEDGTRHRLRQAFPVTCYATGPAPRLRQLWQFLRRRSPPVALARTTRRDLFAGDRDVLAATVAHPAHLPPLFATIRRRFPDLDTYDFDIPLPLRYTAVTHAFPLALCEVSVDDNGRIATITPLDAPGDIVVDPPPLRVLTLFPDANPHHTAVTAIQVGEGQRVWMLPLHPRRALLIQLQATFRRYDPDVVVTRWGDTWLFPLLLDSAAKPGAAGFNPNRDDRPVRRRQAGSHFTYGQVVYRGQQVHLYGRLHIDQHNAVIAKGDGAYGLAGVLEQARVTGLPIQEVARKSPGAGITALQIVVALRQGILVPDQKQQSERFKSAAELLRADRGGLVYQPLTGLHRNVAEIDFVSMYPSIMVAFNISPETVGRGDEDTVRVPGLALTVAQTQDGLVPQALRPLLAKRVAIKGMLARMNRRDCRYAPLQAQAAALKWLLVVCFGYLGYRNARFGRIEGHEAVTAYGREALLRAKETAEVRGYRVLHMYVDGLWVQRIDETERPLTHDELTDLLAAVTAATGLPIALEGIYNWIAFLPSRQDARVPVANRYFGAFTDGSLKLRGIAARRHDTPPWVARVQTAVLETMARVPPGRPLSDALPQMQVIVRRELEALCNGRVPLPDLLVTQRLSREPDAYKTPSPAARAAAQLAAIGKARRPGQQIRLLYLRGGDVHAWDAPLPTDIAARLDDGRYRDLLLRALVDVVTVIGVDPDRATAYLTRDSYQLPLPLDGVGDGYEGMRNGRYVPPSAY